jgi:hypothetical protein
MGEDETQNNWELAEGLEELQPLFEKNDAIFRVSSFDRLKVEGIAPEKLEKIREIHTRIKRLANAYPGLRIGEILDDRQLSATDKRKRVAARTGLLDRFQMQNPKTEFLALDFTPDSSAVQALDFTGFSSDERRMVLATLKSYQRIYSITHDAAHSKLLLEMDHHSPLTIANISLTNFKKSSGLDETVAEEYYNQSRAETTNTVLGVGAVLDAQFGGLSQMAVGNIGPSIG